jgi:hypothetical protein
MYNIPNARNENGSTISCIETVMFAVSYNEIGSSGIVPRIRRWAVEDINSPPPAAITMGLTETLMVRCGLSMLI